MLREAAGCWRRRGGGGGAGAWSGRGPSVDLGAALRRAGRRGDARAALADGADLAHRCGATALAERGREELRLAGARPRRLARAGRDGLTPAELRVAELARHGSTNKEIAQALFVTLRTVEMHLSNAYRKLGIDAREGLAGALDGRDGPEHDGGAPRPSEGVWSRQSSPVPDDENGVIGTKLGERRSAAGAHSVELGSTLCVHSVALRARRLPGPRHSTGALSRPVGVTTV